MDLNHPKIVFVGAGVVGGSVGGWIAEHYDNVYFLDQGQTAQALKENGITLYPQDNPSKKVTTKVKVIDDLDEAKDADVVVLGVKNYSLEPVAQMVKDKLGDAPVIVSMQNGLANQQVLPKIFSKVIYCVVSYNAWADEPGVIGYQKHGPLHVGTLKGELAEETKALSRVFNKGVETHVTDRINDAAHCKLVINLTNSITTLIGHTVKEISDRGLFQKLLSGMTWEGVKIIRAAGYKEVKLGGMPSWLILFLGANFPQFITRPLFEKNVKKMVISSMAQDILQRGGSDSELESINGYIMGLADKHGVSAPINKTVYEICRREFAQEGFKPWDVRDVWAEVVKRG